VNCALVITGDELLRGFVQDANSGYLAERLRASGFDLTHVRICGDALATVVANLRDVIESNSFDLVITTGGLGPTHDDRTVEAIGIVSGRDLELRDDALELVESRVRSFGRMSTPEDAARFEPGNRKQATLPVGSELLEPGGTAPGFVVPATESMPAFVVLPGPPSELQHAWRQAENTVVLTELAKSVAVRHERVVRIFGVPETYVANQLAQLGHEDSAACTVTLCARAGELELSMRGTDDVQVDAIADGVAEAFASHVFARDDERPVAALVGDELRAAGRTLAVAESCTGGLLGSMITDIPRASTWFLGGVISYDNSVKEQLLDVEHDTINRVGAVSEPVVRAMALGACSATGADIGIGITGVAGPGGGTEDKPVGTVWIGIAVEGDVTATKLQIPGSREAVRRRSCNAALHMTLARVRLLVTS
jgi:nicotinamide-nucleotide amidase